MVSGGQIVLSLSRTRARMLGFLPVLLKEGSHAPIGRGSGRSVGMVLCGSSADGSLSAYANAKRNAGTLERSGMSGNDLNDVQ